MSSTCVLTTSARPTDSIRRSPPAVAVLACGDPAHGDAGAAVEACRRLGSRLPVDAVIRNVGQLGVDDLLGVPRGATVVVVDVARGLRPGSIRTLPFDGLVDALCTARPRASQVLALPEVIGLATMLRGHPLIGRIVLIGGREFSSGQPLSERVAGGMARLAAEVLRAVEELRATEPSAEAIRD